MSRRTVTNAMQPSATIVVLLEDDPNDVFFVRRAFEKAQIANPILAFSSAQEARRYLEELRPITPPALFILDITLAGGETGIAFLAWLREQPSPLGATPAMMLTGSERRHERDEAEMLGSICFLHKPVTEEAILSAVQSLNLTLRASDRDAGLDSQEPRPL